jgi:hypothetical protein
MSHPPEPYYYCFRAPEVYNVRPASLKVCFLWMLSLRYHKGGNATVSNSTALYNAVMVLREHFSAQVVDPLQRIQA